MINLKNIYDKSCVKVLSLGFLLFLLNKIPAIHNAIINIDITVAMAMNSVIGFNPAFDHVLAWLNTRTGDAFVLMCMCILFVVHSLRGANLNEIIRRGSFWIWVGVLCAITYGLSCISEYFIKRDTPLLALHQLNNLRTIYGVTFRSCPTSSFPSGHGFAYLFFAIMAYRKYFRMGLLLSCLAIIMLSIRLIVGLHWLSDIIFGSLFLALFLISLIDDTHLKNTYTYVERIVSSVVKNLFAPYKRVVRIDS